MKFPRRRQRQPAGGWMATDGPTNWEPDSHPAYRGFLKQAKRAGKKGDPDPSKSNKAPSCFDALLHMTKDQLHHEMVRMLDETVSSRLTLAAHGHVEQWLSSNSQLTEAEERRLITVREANEVIRSAVLRCQPRVHSIVAVYERVKADMQDAYRHKWPYANHFQELVFPELDLSSIRYLDGEGGFSLAEVLPTQPVDHISTENKIKGVLPR